MDKVQERNEIIEMLGVLKEQAKPCMRKKCTKIVDVKPESFTFVIDRAIAMLKEENDNECNKVYSERK